MLRLKNPALIALLIQIGSTLLVLAFISSQSFLAFSLFEWGVLQGILASIFSFAARMPYWWAAIHLLFLPLLIATLALDITPLWFLIIFMGLWLIYGKTYKTQVPLYLSSKHVPSALASSLPTNRDFSFIDLGSGCGGLLKNLAGIHKNGRFYGIESAPAPFLISKLRNVWSVSDYKIVWGDFWQHDFSKYDVVYAYLSPVPMESLWQKACREMRPGSLLISNTFIIPGITPYKSIPLNDFSNSTLYLWKIGNKD